MAAGTYSSPVVNDLIAWPLALWRSYKATRGTQAEVTTHMNVGEGVSLDVDVNVHKKKRNKGRLRRVRERERFLKEEDHQDAAGTTD